MSYGFDRHCECHANRLVLRVANWSLFGRMAYIYLSMALFPLQNAIEEPNKLSQSAMIQSNRVTDHHGAIEVLSCKLSGCKNLVPIQRCHLFFCTSELEASSNYHFGLIQRFIIRKMNILLGSKRNFDQSCGHNYIMLPLYREQHSFPW